MRDDGGGGIIGTPIVVLSNRKAPTEGQRLRQSSGDVLAPPTARYLRLLSHEKLRFERDALNDVYREPVDLLKKTQHSAGTPEAFSTTRGSDKSENALALKTLEDEDRSEAAGANILSDAVNEVVPAPCRTSIGYCLLRAHGFSSVASHEESVRDSERRKFYESSALNAVFTSLNSGTAISHEISRSSLLDNMGICSKNSFQFGADDGSVDQARCQDNDIDGTSGTMATVDEAFDAYEGAAEGSLFRGASRIDDALRKHREKSKNHHLKHAVVAAKDMSGPSNDYIQSNFSKVASERNVNLSFQRSTPVVPDAFVNHPKHDWERDMFHADDVLSNGRDTEVRDSVAILQKTFQTKMNSVAWKLRTRRDAILACRRAKLLHLQAYAASSLRQSFAPESGQQATNGGKRVDENMNSEDCARSIGDVARNVLSWKPHLAVSKAFGVTKKRHLNQFDQQLSSDEESRTAEKRSVPAGDMHSSSADEHLFEPPSSVDNTDDGFRVTKILRRISTDEHIAREYLTEHDEDDRDHSIELKENEDDIERNAEDVDAQERLREFVFGTAKNRGQEELSNAKGSPSSSLPFFIYKKSQAQVGEGTDDGRTRVKGDEGLESSGVEKAENQSVVGLNREIKVCGQSDAVNGSTGSAIVRRFRRWRAADFF